MRISTIGNCGRRACQYVQRWGRNILLIVLVIAPALSHASANQTVQLLVNTPAGGPLDGLGRRLAAALSNGGLPAEVRNVPGNGGMIGAVKLLEEPADGRTLLLTNAFPLGLASGVGDGFPYNPLADFVPVAPIARAPLVVTVPSSSRYGKISDLISAAKSKNLMLGTTGHGPTSIAGTLFSKGTGGKVEQVPYRGIGSVLADLTGANGLDFTIADLASVRTLLESGKLRVLAVTGKARHPALPKVPTLAESGVPGVDISAWAAVMVRAGTPDDIVNALARHIERAMSADAELKKYLDSFGTAPWTGGGAAVTEAIRLDMHSSSMASAAGHPRVAYSMPAARSQVASAPAPAFPAVAASPAVTPTTRPSSVREEEDVPKVPTPFEVIMGIAGAVNEGRRQADERTAQWARQREEEARKWGEQASRAAAERERQAQQEAEANRQFEQRRQAQLERERQQQQLQQERQQLQQERQQLEQEQRRQAKELQRQQQMALAERQRQEQQAREQAAQRSAQRQQQARQAEVAITYTPSHSTECFSEEKISCFYRVRVHNTSSVIIHCTADVTFYREDFGQRRQSRARDSGQVGIGMTSTVSSNNGFDGGYTVHCVKA